MDITNNNNSNNHHTLPAVPGITNVIGGNMIGDIKKIAEEMGEFAFNRPWCSLNEIEQTLCNARAGKIYDLITPKGDACPECHGEGKVLMGADDGMICPECNGNGFIRIGEGDHEASEKCADCNGTGKVAPKGDDEGLLKEERINQFNHYGESVVSEDNWDIYGLLKALFDEKGER